MVDPRRIPCHRRPTRQTSPQVAHAGGQTPGGGPGAVVHASAVDQAWTEIRRQPLRLAPGWLFSPGLLYALGMRQGLFWHRTLRSLGQPVTLGDTLRAFFIGHLGKYVPGKAMVIVLRSGLLRPARWMWAWWWPAYSWPRWR